MHGYPSACRRRHHNVTADEVIGRIIREKSVRELENHAVVHDDWTVGVVIVRQVTMLMP